MGLTESVKGLDQVEYIFGPWSRANIEVTG